MPGPFAFADPDRTLCIVEQAGFRRPQVTPVGAGMRWAEPATALDYVMEMGVLGRALQDQPEGIRSKVREAVGEALAGHTGDDGAVVLDCAAWLVTAAA